MVGDIHQLRQDITIRCRCGHFYADHAAHPPHRCVTFQAPDCPCEAFKEASAETPGTAEDKGGGHNGEAVAAPCTSCAGTGWKPYPDPVLKDLALHRCPDCEGET